MSEPTLLRRLAEALLSAALRVAPSDTLEWGHAMLSELRHVEGNWSAFFWSLGSAGVLAKHALVAMIFPSANRSGIPSGGDLFSKEGSMRKPALVMTASCVLASLLFFLAPVYRQAFHISLAQWHNVIHVHSLLDEPQHDNATLESLAQKAEQNQDAEALAFVATHTINAALATRLANEAVQRDASLTWIYAVAFTGYPAPPETKHWLADLEKFDPQNALPHLIAAQKFGRTVIFSKEFPRGHTQPNPGWEEAMAGAFQSSRLETYTTRQKELERRVIARYGITDPFEIVGDDYHDGMPSYAAWYSECYAQSLIEAGEKVEAQGDRKGAFEKYASVAKFAQLMGDRSPLLYDPTLRGALAHLEMVSRKNGNPEQAGLYAALAAQAGRQREEKIAALRARFQGRSLSDWYAFVARASGVAMLLSSFILLTCFVAVIIRSRTIRFAGLRPSVLTLAMACSSAVVALFSSILLYVSYRPYAEIFQRFVNSGDESGIPELSDFLARTQVPLGTGANRFLDFQSTVFYFWFGVALLCALALVFGVLRYLQTRPRTTAA